MRYFFIILLASTSSFAHAQQPKAYEIIRYVAEASGNSFWLEYPDGYPAGSKILVVPSHKSAVAYLPVGGVPEANGDFLFRPGNIKSELILTHINQERIAPKTIAALYKINNKSYKLIFHRKL